MLPSLEMNVETSGRLDLSGELPPVMLEEQVRGFRAWGATDLVSEDRTIQLSENALKEIHAIAETIRNHPLPDFHRGPKILKSPFKKNRLIREIHIGSRLRILCDGTIPVGKPG